jgi:aminodeoxychorismate synthase component I
MGADPVAVFAARREPPDSQPFAAKIEVQRCKTAAGEPLGKLRIECCRGDALWHLRQLLAEYAVPFRDGARESFPLLAGGVGYFGYEAGSWSGPGGVLKTADSSQAPDIYFALYDTVLCHDHAKGKTFLSVVGRGKTEREAGQQAASAAAAVRQKVAAAIMAPAAETDALDWQPDASLAPEAGFNENSYCEAVQQIRQHIDAGDIYQACMTQRFRSPLDDCDPWDLYALLRQINPAPFACFLQAPEFCVVSSSPERYLSVDATGWAESRPIKGTRPRGTTPIADAALREQLANSVKDQAENIMIVDLVRNDFGRVCQFGSIEVAELMAIEPYATVFQMVSTIRGRLGEEYDALDLIRATFPGGSMTGAPKIEAMKILDRLEPVRRGIYSGAIGYLDLGGLIDLNIVIRTFIIERDVCSYHAGGAVVADSDPRGEYLESLDKIRALQGALACLKKQRTPAAVMG